MKKKEKIGKNNSKDNKNKSKKEETVLNYNEIEIDGFQAFFPIMPSENYNNTQNNLENEINPFQIKNLDDLINSWKNIEEQENSKEQNELFENLWDNIIKINKNNILDYSLINKIIKFLGDDYIIQRFLFLLYNLIQDEYNQEKIN